MKTDAHTSGLLYVFTGDGKGKTSAALGVLVRALAHGWKVGWISWYKEASWGISEHALQTILHNTTLGRLTFLPMGKGFYLKDAVTETARGTKIVHAKTVVIQDNHDVSEHARAARKALEKAMQLLPTVDVLILDEVLNAISDGLLKESDVLRVIKKRKSTHIILTGRNATTNMIEVADLVSNIQKVKHPFDTGKLAVKGLDF